MIYGMLNFTPMVLLPPLLQQHAGFPDMLIGEIIAARGVGATHRLLPRDLRRPHGPADRPDRRLRPAGDLGPVADEHSTSMSTPSTLMANSLLQGIAIGVIWVPLTLATFATHRARPTSPRATAVYHLLRNIGSSFFISICVAEIVRATGANYSRMVEMVNPFNRSLALPWVMGGWDTETGRAGWPGCRRRSAGRPRCSATSTPSASTRWPRRWRFRSSCWSAGGRGRANVHSTSPSTPPLNQVDGKPKSG